MDAIAKKAFSSIACAVLGIILIISTLMHWSRSAEVPSGLLADASGSEPLGAKPWFTTRVLDLLAIDPGAFQALSDSGGLHQLFGYPQIPPLEVVVEELLPVPPPPPALSMRSVAVSYRGLFRDSRGQVHIYLLIGEETKVHQLGDEFLLDWSITAVEASHVIAVSSAGQKIEIPFNGKKSLEVVTQ